MAETFVISSYNCRSIKKSILDVQNICMISDIVFLQEHWLPTQELDYLNNVSTSFCSISSSPVDLSEGILVGRPYGGLAILFKKSLASNIKVIESTSKRLLMVEIVNNDSSKILLVNCYLPYDNGIDSFELYINLLYEIQAVVTENNYIDVLMMGDFNCDINSDLFGELSEFSNQNNYFMSDIVLLGINSNTKTFYSDANGSMRWLDHVLASHHVHSNIQSIEILENFIISDHRPISLSLNPDFLTKCTDLDEDPSSKFSIKWSVINENQINQYKANIRENCNINVPSSILYLNQSNKYSVKQDINIYYDQIVNCLATSSNFMSVNCRTGSGAQYGQVPGWNEFVKDHHDLARDHFLYWRSVGSPRIGIDYVNMNTSRMRFKLALNQCKRNKDMITANKIGVAFAQNESKDFWKNINKLSGTRSVNSTNIEGITGTDSILEFWKGHFKTLLSSVDRTKKSSDYNHSLVNEMKITVGDIINAIKTLSKGKSAGPDDLSAEHLIHSNEIIYIHLSILFTAILRYGIIPDNLMKVHIVPLIKNKCGNIASKDNYRPISLSCVISKLLERIILNIIMKYLNVSENQFAFKKSHSTNMCIYILKQTLFDYTSNDTPIYTCFLDIRKAFDRVNNDKILNILIRRGVPLYIIELLLFWFLNQLFYVRWQGRLSDSFNPKCGLRQGSVLSPILFNVYIDELSQSLNNVSSGCYIGNEFLNHVCYADDLVIFSPSLKGLNSLLKVCDEFGKNFDVIFNCLKSKCIVFRKHGELFHDKIYLSNNEIEIVESIQYLGVTLHYNMSDNDEICNQYRKLCSRVNVLGRKFNKCSFEVKNELFRVFCTNIYGINLWCNFSKKVLNKFRVCYNNGFRIMHGLARYCSASGMFVNAGVLSFGEMVRHGQWSFVRSVISSENRLIQAANTIQHSLLWLKYRKDLFC